mgnify:FL=1
MMVEGECYSPDSNVPFMSRDGTLNMYQIYNMVHKLNHRIINRSYMM